jgi:hypothetical protein
MKVKIKTRQVYHRYAEVEIDVHDMECHRLHEYLLENEHLYTDEIDDKISKAEYICGNGCDNDINWTEPSADSEWRFEYSEGKYGGHL